MGWSIRAYASGRWTEQYYLGDVGLGDVQGERSSSSRSRPEAVGQQAQRVALAQTATDPLIALRLWTSAIETAPDAALATTAHVDGARLLVAQAKEH